MSRIEIEFIANSGVCVRWPGRTCLIDAVFGSSSYFSPLPKEMKKAAFGMTSRFRDADYVLFTHRHVDHFNAGMADEYAANNQVKYLIAPKAGEDPKSILEDRGSLKKAAAKGILTEVDTDLLQTKTYVLETAGDGGEKVTAEYLRCRHLDHKTYPAVLHNALLMQIGGRQLLFLADADTEAENAALFREVRKPDAVFVTPLFYLDPRGRAILREMEPARTVLYHLPFAEDDTTDLRSLAARLKAEHEEDASLMLFDKPEQNIIIE